VTGVRRRWRRAGGIPDRARGIVSSTDRPIRQREGLGWPSKPGPQARPVRGPSIEAGPGAGAASRTGAASDECSRQVVAPAWAMFLISCRNPTKQPAGPSISCRWCRESTSREPRSSRTFTWCRSGPRA